MATPIRRSDGTLAHSPTKLTPSVHSCIVEAISNGARKTNAFRMAGLSKERCFTNLGKARKQVTEARVATIDEMKDYVSETDFKWICLLRDIEYAQAVWEQRKLEVITQASEAGEWQAAAWQLERRLPEHYGQRRDRSPIEEGDELRVEITAQLHDDDARRAVGDFLRAVAQPGDPLPSGPGGSEDAAYEAEVIGEEILES